MSDPKRNRLRTVSAWLCLLAVTSLYAPLAAAAWSTRAFACCTGDHCPIKGHHHRQAPTRQSSPMDCGHDVTEMMACSMSCCQDSDHTLLAAHTFVLPYVISVSAPGDSARAVEKACTIERSPYSEPVSPPPRFSSKVL